MPQVLSRKLLLPLTGVVMLLVSLAFGFTKVRSVISRRHAVTVTRLNQIPQVVLWAWERPTDLRFIDPKEVGVAFLARTIRLRSGEVVVRPRLQPLNLPEGAKVI